MRRTLCRIESRLASSPCCIPLSPLKPLQGPRRPRPSHAFALRPRMAEGFHTVSLASLSSKSFESSFSGDPSEVPKELRLRKDKRFLSVEFGDGKKVDFPALFLRERSRSAEHIGHDGLPASNKKIPDTITIMSLELIGSYAVRIVFDDLHATGIYSWKYLRELAGEVNPTVDASATQKGDHLVSLNGETFHYLEWRPQSTPKGPKSSEIPTIICLHGFNQTAHSWDEFGTTAGSKYRVLALDQRGHGDSFRVGERDGKYGAEDMVLDLKNFADKLDIKKFILVGMSMGARNSVLFSTTYPEMVERLVLVDWAPAIEEKGVAKIIEALSYEANSFEEAVTAIHSMNPRRPREQIKDRLTYSMYQKPSGVWGWRVPGQLFQKRFTDEYNPIFTEKMWESVASLSCPTLLIRGKESDVLALETAKKMAATSARLRFVEIEAAGHSVAGDNPTAFYLAVTSFLSQPQ